MSNLSSAHAILQMLLVHLGAVPTFLLMLAQLVLSASLPVLNLLVPGVIAVLAHRWIKNQALADLFAQAGGVAYSALGTKLAEPGVTNFAVAKAMAIAMATSTITDVAQKQLSKLTPDQVADKVEGALGRLLAIDPNFSLAKGVVSPTPLPVTIDVVEDSQTGPSNAATMLAAVKLRSQPGALAAVVSLINPLAS